MPRPTIGDICPVTVHQVMPIGWRTCYLSCFSPEAIHWFKTKKKSCDDEHQVKQSDLRVASVKFEFCRTKMATVVCCCEQTQPDGWQTSASVKGESAAVGVESNGRVIIRRNVQKEPRGESRTQAPEWRQRLDVWPAPDLPDSSSLATHSLQLAKRTACCILLFSPNLHPSEKKKKVDAFRLNGLKLITFRWNVIHFVTDRQFWKGCTFHLLRRIRWDEQVDHQLTKFNGNPLGHGGLFKWDAIHSINDCVIISCLSRPCETPDELLLQVWKHKLCPNFPHLAPFHFQVIRYSGGEQFNWNVFSLNNCLPGQGRWGHTCAQLKKSKKNFFGGKKKKLFQVFTWAVTRH